MDISYKDEYKYAYKAYWKLLFYANQRESGDYLSLSEYLTVKSEKVYSNFQEEKDRPRKQGKYEFLLEYPALDGYNRWKQSNFPLNEPDSNNKTTAEGYVGIHTSWNINNWGGLVLSTNEQGYCLLDGSVGSEYWYYTIGYVGNVPKWQNGFPGPGEIVQEVYLWMRISMHPHFRESVNSNTCFLGYILYFVMFIK